MFLVCFRLSLSRQSSLEKNKASKPNWANIEAISRLCPKGSICQAIFGAAHDPKVSLIYLKTNYLKHIYKVLINNKVL